MNHKNILLCAFQLMSLQILLISNQSNLHLIQKFVSFQQMLLSCNQLKTFGFPPVLANLENDGVLIHFNTCKLIQKIHFIQYMIEINTLLKKVFKKLIFFLLLLETSKLQNFKVL